MRDVLDGALDGLAVVQEIEVVLRDEAELQQVAAQECQPRLPVRAAGLVHEHEREDARLARLHEREHLEAFVHRAEAAGEKRDGVRLLHEVQLAGEEIVEVHQLLVAVDRLVRRLLEGQPDVQSEAVLAARATLRCAHDAVAAAGHDHVAALAHLASKFFRCFEFLRILRGARAAEDGDLPALTVRRKDAARKAQLFQCAVEHFQIGHARPVACHFQRGDDHFFDQLARLLHLDFVHEFADFLVEPWVADGVAADGPVASAAVGILHGKCVGCPCILAARGPIARWKNIACETSKLTPRRIKDPAR